MRPDLFRNLLTAKPFRPFRVYVSDGFIYDVAHPETAWVLGFMLVMHIDSSGFGDPPGQRLANISMIHITRVEVYYPGAAPTPAPPPGNAPPAPPPGAAPAP